MPTRRTANSLVANVTSALRRTALGTIPAPVQVASIPQFGSLDYERNPTTAWKGLFGLSVANGELRTQICRALKLVDERNGIVFKRNPAIAEWN